MFHLAWQELRRRPGTLLGALVMTVIGAALITAFLVLYSSIHQTRTPVERYAGAPVVAVGSPGMFTPQLVADLAATDGVARAVPELTFPAQLLDASGAPVVPQKDVAQFGHSWESAALGPLTVADGAAPSGADEVVVDEALARRAGVGVGARVPVDVGGAVHHLTICGTTRSPGGQTLQRGLYFTPRRAAELAGRGQGRVDAVGFLTAPGTDPGALASALRAHLADALAGDLTPPSGVPAYRVASGADRGELENVIPDHRATSQSLYLLVWIVAVMALVLVAGALVSSVRRRAAQIALIRAVGATPHQVRVLCQAEALLLAAVAAVVGVPAGVLLAWALIALVRPSGSVSRVLALHVDPVSIASAVLLLVVVTQAAAWWTARAALRTRPGDIGAVAVHTRRSRAWARVRSAGGAIAILAAGAVQAAGMAGALPTSVMGTYGLMASLLIIVGVALLGSLLVRLLALVLSRPVGSVSPVSGYLATANVAHHHRRYAGVTVPMTVGLALAGWAMVGLPLYALGNAHQFADAIDEGTLVVETPLVRGTPTGLSPQARERVAHSAGVRDAAGFWQGWVAAVPTGKEPVDSASTWGMIADGRFAPQLDLGALDGDMAAVEAGRGVALARSYASRTGSTVGSRVEVYLPGAARVTTLPVAALYDGSGNGDHSVIVAQQAVAGAVGTRWYDYLLASGSADVPSVAAALAPATVRVEPHDGVVDAYVAGRTDLAASPGTIGVVLVGGFLVLASVNALVLAHTDRERELVALRRLSATPGESRRLVAWEMVLTVVPACLLGLLAVAWMAFSMSGADLAAAVWAYPTLPLLALSAVAVVGAVGASLLLVGGIQRRIASGRPNV